MDWIRSSAKFRGVEIGHDDYLPIALVVWQAMSRCKGGRLRTVSQTELDKAAAKTLRFTKDLKSLSGSEKVSFVKQFHESFNQQHLLEFCMTCLALGAGERGEPARGGFALDLIEFRTLIDCLDRPL